ncbi:MAG: ABC transporter substrate-binding protein [Bacteroidota bacterium]
MKLLSLYKKLPFFIVLLLLVWGCKQPETVVIGDAPTVSAPSDTAEYSPGDDESDFRKLVIGEQQSISSFDPLLVDNNAAMRALQLVYEGLVRLDSDGNPSPAIAKNWEVSNDSLTYTFTLNRDTYYHDSDIFNTGTGRRLSARDVKFVFERMAKTENPPAAAKLFWDIKGFEPFYQEQHEVFEPRKRTLDGVSGIQADNDSTIVFELHEKDSEFLNKLATPYALIYPREAVSTTQGKFAAVGTGPFELSSQNQDSTFILAKSEKYREASRIRINRIDIITSNSESSLMRQLEQGDIHLLPELGPNMIQHFTADNGNLHADFEDHYSLTTRSQPELFVLRANSNADITSGDADIFSQLAYADTSYFEKLPESIVSLEPKNGEQESADTTITQDELLAVYSENSFIRTYLGSLSDALERGDAQLSMTKFRTPTRLTNLWVTTHSPLIHQENAQLNNDFPPLLRFLVYPTALHRNEITNLDFNEYGWWIDLRGVSLPTLNNLN